LLTVEEVDETEGGQRRLVEQSELAAFHSLEKALTYRYELSQKYSPQVTGETEVIDEMTSPESFSAGD